MENLSKILVALTVMCTPGFAGIYVGIEGGDSISTNTHFQPDIVFPRETDAFFATPANTDWTRDIGSAPLVGVFAGFECNPNLAFQFDYSYRSGYDWKVLITEADSFAAPDIYDTAEAENIRIQTFLFDVILRPCTDCCAFVPYIKAGIGVANNRIKGIHSIDTPFGGRELSFDIQQEGASSTNFAWNVGVGADYYITRKLSFGFGYRFVDTGRLRSGSKFTDSVSGITGTTTPFVTNHIYLNELTACLTYHFDCL